MTVKVVNIISIGEVTFKPNSRSKGIRMSVRAGRKILVSYPLYVSYREAARFVEQHADWIANQQQKIEKITPEYSEDTAIQTHFHKITFLRAGEKFAVRQNHENIEIVFPDTDLPGDQKTQQFFQRVLTEIYRREAKQYLPHRLSDLAGQNGFHYGNLTIRNNRTNWGSCSGHNNISLNLNLMKLPDHLIDYIILHELVHTRVKNHSPLFWKNLDGITGDQAHKLAAELKKHSTYTI